MLPMRQSMRKIWVLFLVVVCVLSAWCAYDNVLSDIEPIRALAEAAACKLKPCAERHAMTKLDRTPLGQSFEFTWQSGIVVVECKRSGVVFGTRACSAK